VLSDHIDHEWLPDLIAGDENAFKLFFELYHNKLYKFSYQYLKNHQLAEDLTQDVFIKIWQEKTKLREVENLDAYLFQIVKRKTIDCLRQIARDNKVQSQLKLTHDSSCYPIQELENTKYLEKLKKGLTPQQLAVFELSREKGMTYEMIAEELSISKNTVRNHMVEALRYLKKALSKPFFTITSIFIFFN
jgi:RNA polymerase sigma-70 factor (ECF subfamily)